MTPLLKLKRGVSLDYAVATIQSLAADARNARSAGHEWFQVRDAYLRWVETVETQLCSLTADGSILQAVQNGHYWQLQDASALFARPMPMISSELERQQEFFDALAAQLVERRDRAAGAPGLLTVLDTHVLLHYLPPDQIPWPEVVQSDQVRLVIPLRVIEELDQKKWTARDKLASRARDILPRIAQTVGRGGAPGVLRKGVTLEVALPPRPRDKPDDADEEILSACEELASMHQIPPTLVTGDTAMTIRAEAADIVVTPMPDRFERRETTAPTT